MLKGSPARFHFPLAVAQFTKAFQGPFVCQERAPPDTIRLEKNHTVRKRIRRCSARAALVFAGNRRTLIVPFARSNEERKARIAKAREPVLRADCRRSTTLASTGCTRSFDRRRTGGATNNALRRARHNTFTWRAHDAARKTR